MRVRISDKQALLSISPAQLMAYLRSKGARQVDEFSGKATVWSYGDEELLVPLATRFADYAARMADILASLEREEDRSQLQILTDLQNSGFDVVRVRNVSEDTRTGTLNFMRSVDFVAQTRDLLLAAACSAATHKISYPGRKPQDAEHFMDSVRFGQTVQGSFVLQILSPVILESHTQGTLFDLPEVLPYKKRVIPTLESGLKALNTVARQTSKDKNIDHFRQAAPQGVTTNLCDALVSLHESLTPRYIEFSITYSVNRRQALPLARISVDSGYIPLIREASEHIKAIEPETAQTVRGVVVELLSDDPAEAGKIKIRDLTTFRPRLLLVELSGADYTRAHTAHINRQLVELTGTVVKSGRTLRLVADSPLTIVEDNA